MCKYHADKDGRNRVILKNCQFRRLIAPLLAVLVGLEKHPNFQDEKRVVRIKFIEFTILIFTIYDCIVLVFQ